MVLWCYRYLDDQVALLVAGLKANANMWDDTLLVFAADNGGAIYTPVRIIVGRSTPPRPNGGQFDFVRPSARRSAPWGR